MRSAAQASDPARQTRKESELHYRVHRVRCELEQAARGDHTAYALSNAAESIAAHYRDAAGPISAAQRDELLTAVVRAHLGAIKHLPEWYRREQIDAGLRAKSCCGPRPANDRRSERGTRSPISTPTPECFGTICTTFRCVKRLTAALGSAANGTFNRCEIEAD